MADAPRDEDAPPTGKEAPSDIAAIEVDDAEQGGAAPANSDPRRAYEVLEIRTPLEEFDAYVRARLETLTRLGESKKAELTAEALELGRAALARVTGVTLPASQDKQPRG